MIRDIGMGALQQVTGILLAVGGALFEHPDTQELAAHERSAGRARIRRAIGGRALPKARRACVAMDEVHP